MRNIEELAGQIKANEFLFEEESQTFHLFDLGINDMNKTILSFIEIQLHNSLFPRFLNVCKQLCAHICSF